MKAMGITNRRADHQLAAGLACSITGTDPPARNIRNSAEILRHLTEVSQDRARTWESLKPVIAQADCEHEPGQQQELARELTSVLGGIGFGHDNETLRIEAVDQLCSVATAF